MNGKLASGLIVLALSIACLPAGAVAGTRLRGVLLIDFGAGIPNPTPSSVTFSVPPMIRGKQDFNFPANGKPGLQIPEACRGNFTVDMSSNPSCNELAGTLVGSSNGGKALVRLETPNRRLGGIFTTEVTSGAACSLFEGNITSGSDPFAGDLECSLIGETFVWQAQIAAGLASTVPQFFGIDPALTIVIPKVFNLQGTADSGIGINNSSIELRFRKP